MYIEIIVGKPYIFGFRRNGRVFENLELTNTYKITILGTKIA